MDGHITDLGARNNPGSRLRRYRRHVHLANFLLDDRRIVVARGIHADQQGGFLFIIRLFFWRGTFFCCQTMKPRQ